VAERIDPTWIAYAFDRPAAAGRIERGLERVKAHYGRLVNYELTVQRADVGEQRGVATVGAADSLSAWPYFAAAPGVAIASAYVPAGWERLVGDVPPGEAAPALARALLREPDRGAESLIAPTVVGMLDTEAERLVVLNDCIGVARLFETHLADGLVWSNRAAAGHVLAGIPIEPSERGWRLLASTNWFFGDSTPIRGVRRVARGEVVEADRDGTRRRQTEVLGRLVAGGSGAAGDHLREAADHAVGHVRLADSLWSEPPVVHLSGGRDSRLVAAAALAGEVDAVFRTSDNNPGEADVARRLVAAAPRPMQHDVVKTGEAEGPETPLLERSYRGQLLHDCMRHASKVRRDVNLPRSRPKRATLAGWGGEIAHAFYYKNARQLRTVRRKGTQGAIKRLLESSRKKHSAAHEEAYELASSEYRAALAEGESHGLEGADLLDWFYLVERFAHRFEVGADSQVMSIYTSPAFIRAAFATTPEQRLDSYAHREMIAALVPAWADVPFYKREAGPRPALRRKRLWEAADDADAIAAIIAKEGPWTELFRPDRTREMWAELRAGGGYADWETVFERIAFREAFERFRDDINEAAAEGPALFDGVVAAAGS
jgi:hypothetical protein